MRAAEETHAPATVSRKRRQTRARLLDAAYDVFREVGLGAATVDMIVERAGFTRGAFYSNFDSKSDLFVALAERENERCLRQAEQGARAAVDILDAKHGVRPATSQAEAILRSVVDRFLALQVAAPGWFALDQEIWLYGMRNPDFGATMLQFSHRLIARVATIMKGITDRYGLSWTVDPKTATRALVATYGQFVRETEVSRSAAARERLRVDTREALAALVRALTAPSGTDVPTDPPSPAVDHSATTSSKS